MKDDRRRRDDFRFKHQDVQIVVEMWSSTAMSRPTKHPRMTLAIVAHSADVLVVGMREKNIGGRVHALGATLKAATDSRQRVEIDILRDRYEKVRILRTALFCCQRPDEGDPVHAPKGACSEDKLEYELEQRPADIVRGTVSILPLVSWYGATPHVLSAKTTVMASQRRQQRESTMPCICSLPNSCVAVPLTL